MLSFGPADDTAREPALHESRWAWASPPNAIGPGERKMVSPSPVGRGKSRLDR